MSATFIYITASSADEAVAIGRTLVDERLAACANVLPGMTSVYRWEGRIEHGEEASMILKTHADLVERLTERVREMHSYDCPCVVAQPIIGGNPDFIQWILSETQPVAP